MQVSHTTGLIHLFTPDDDDYTDSMILNRLNVENLEGTAQIKTLRSIEDLGCVNIVETNNNKDGVVDANDITHENKDIYTDNNKK